MTANTEDIYVDDDGNVIENAPPAEPVTGGEEAEASTPANEEGSASTDADDDHDEGSEASTEENAAGTDDEREAIRERRRLERQNKRQRQKEREESLRNELAARDAAISEMRERLDAIQRKTTGSELA